MTEQQKYMKAALRLAQKAAEEGEVPVGAVVVCEGKIVGRGRNRRETKKNALHHAEIEAIEKACRKLGGWRLHKCDLYVTLEPVSYTHLPCGSVSSICPACLSHSSRSAADRAKMWRSIWRRGRTGCVTQ